MKRTVTLGLMSGTSLDGVDAVAVDFAGARPELLAHTHTPFPKSLIDALSALVLPGDNEIVRMGKAYAALGACYAEAVKSAVTAAGLRPGDIAAAGIHGQTIRHMPEHGFSLQFNNPAAVAELTGIDVVADFRSRDLAAGGEGAPLVPAFHAGIFQADRPRAVINMGGISNITHLPAAGSDEKVAGFDCGPGNMLMDAWCRRHLGAPFDCGGAWARSGRCSPGLLEKLLADPFFARKPPKSTGRELFNLGWLEAKLADEAPADVEATLLELTARSVMDALEAFTPGADEIFICGGGALNTALMERLSELSRDAPVRSTAALGVDPMHVEAMAFAWLAWAFLERLPGNLQAVTGARGPRILGALYPA